MKKTMILTTAACAAMLLTGCMSKEETEALSAWTVERYTAQAMAIQQRGAWREMLADVSADEPEIGEMVAADAPAPVAEQTKAILQETETAGVETPKPTVQAAERQEAKTQEPEPREVPPATEPDPAPEAKAASGPAPAAADPTPIPKSEWPYITCPPEPTPAPKIDWPYPAITCPPEPTPTPQPERTEPPAPAEPDPAPMPSAEPTEPVPTPIPTTEPVETPPAIPEPISKPSGGYAVCSCGATLTPDELVSHMKAHAMNGESHSYVAY